MSLPNWTVPTGIALAIVVSSIVSTYDVYVRGNYNEGHFTTTDKNREVCKLHSADLHLTFDRVAAKANVYARGYWPLVDIGNVKSTASILANTRMVSVGLNFSHSCSTSGSIYE